MVVLSMKWSLKKWIILLLAVAMVAVVVAAMKNNDVGTPLETPEARVQFLQGLGWEVKEGETAREVTIPDPFDEIFENYNALQKKAGYDLTPYKGKSAVQYTYEILNFPNAEKSAIIKADILLYDGKVIGGDIYCPKLDGFMYGLMSREEVEKGASR